MSIEIPETVEPILAWVRSKPASTVVGTCANPDACLITEYLSERYPGYLFEVQPFAPEFTGEVHWMREEDWCHIWGTIQEQMLSVTAPLPVPLNALACVFDDLATEEEREQGGEAMMMTAGEFLKRYKEATA